MRHHHRHMPPPRHHFRHFRRRPMRRGGRLLGMVGLAALGYTLLERNRQRQTRMQPDAFVEWERET